MPNTTITTTPYPAYTAVPDVPADLLAAILQLEKFVIPRFTTEAARDTAIPAPVPGQLAYANTFLKQYTTSGWVDINDVNISTAAPTMTGVWSSLAANPVNLSKQGNVVTLQGQVSTSATATAASNQNILTLPIGFRPATTKAFVAHSSQGQVLLTVTSGGIVGLGSTYAAANVVSGGFIYLDPINFRTD